MVFDIVKLGPERTFRYAKHTRKLFAQISHLRGVRQTVFGLSQHAETRSGVQNLFVQVCGRIARDTDVVYVLELYAGGVETVTKRMFRETGAMLDAIEAFFFDGGDQSAVFDDGRCSVAVIGVDAENVHRESIR